MREYASLNQEMLAELQEALGAEYVLTDADKLDQYKTDEETDARMFHLPEAVVLPGSTEEVAAVVKLCNKYNVPVTVRGGGTSLADGAIPVCGGIVLLMERMNKILEMDTTAMYMVVEAGVRTIDIQKQANAAGFLYAGDPCSAESCQMISN